MKTKKILLGIVLFMLSTNVYAKSNEEFYVNENNINMTEEQYQWIVNEFDENFAKYVNEDTFNDLVPKMERTIISNEVIYSKIDSFIDIDGNVLIGDEEIITKEEYESGIELYTSCGNSCWETEYKKLSATISKDSSDNYFIRSTMTWKKFPTVRSTDVYGMIYQNFKVSQRKMNMYSKYASENTMSTKPVGSTGSLLKYGTSNQYRDGEWAGLYTLPDNMKKSEYLYFDMETVGWKYGSIKANISYQHSQSYIGLYDVYNSLGFSWNGMGGVFNFGSYTNDYDHTGGITITG